MDQGDLRRRRAVRRLALGTAVLVAALGGALLFAVAGPASHQQAGGTAPSGTTTVSATPTQLPGSPGAGPVVVLPKPSGVIGGVPVGYPHTEQGAISAAAHYLTVLDWTDQTQAAAQLGVMASPSDKAALLAQVPDAVSQMRQSLGLTGDANSTDASYIGMQPSAFHVESAAPDQVTVALLIVTTTSRLGTDAQNGLMTLPAVMQWTGGDWKLTNGSPSQADPQPAQPGTADAQAKGWTSLALAQ
jgi:hypothetical protein